MLACILFKVKGHAESIPSNYKQAFMTCWESNSFGSCSDSSCQSDFKVERKFWGKGRKVMREQGEGYKGVLIIKGLKMQIFYFNSTMRKMWEMKQACIFSPLYSVRLSEGALEDRGNCSKVLLWRTLISLTSIRAHTGLAY